MSRFDEVTLKETASAIMRIVELLNTLIIQQKIIIRHLEKASDEVFIEDDVKQ